MDAVRRAFRHVIRPMRPKDLDELFVNAAYYS
jgi:hypothetical protein